MRSAIYRAHLGLGWRPASAAAVARRVANRTVLVTGATSGIGRATGLALGLAGATVIGLARRTDELDRLAETLAGIGAGSTMIGCDLSEPDEVAAALARLADHDIDTVVSCAGLSIHRSLAHSIDRAHDLRRSAGVNLLGPAQLITGLLPDMLARGRGQVVGIGSVSAVVPTAGWTAYAATKAGMDSWLRAAAAEVAGHQIAFTTIHFPMVTTAMSAPTIGTRWALTDDQAASVVLATLVRGTHRLIPWWARLAGGSSLQIGRPAGARSGRPG